MSEASVVETLRALAGRATVLVVSHRIRVAEAADHVIVIDDGRVVERGAPARLLMADGPFRRLADIGSESPET